MTKYVKLINGNQLKTLTSMGEYLDEDKLNEAGFKEFVPAQYEQGKPYKWSYEETATQIIEHVEEIIPNPTDILNSAKETKIRENDEIRDNALNAGVEYKGILFDSDTEQKINLLGMISILGDEDMITWYGMNNESLNCSKDDLYAIGELITQLHKFCWDKNAEIKADIAEAETLEEVEAIEIDYSME